MPFGIFQKKPTVKEQVRESKRELRGGARNIDREIAQLKREEAKLVQEIKAAAKSGNEASVRILAKSVVRVRAQITKLYSSQAQLRGVSTNIMTAAATSSLATSMGQATSTMSSMNVAMDPRKVNSTMAQFSKENMKMEMTSEMMDDAINSAMDDDDLEEEGENVMNQVLEGLGVDLSAAAPNARTNKVAQQQQEQEDEGEMHAFEARLQHLKT
mmetsp:Transcript_35241/g.104253  ORF Transcript_35241/g.104253 Transcript_35241/m.104253 type:complete len:214 (-) Transcript_35241:467-1108(-)